MRRNLTLRNGAGDSDGELRRPPLQMNKTPILRLSASEGQRPLLLLPHLVIKILALLSQSAMGVCNL